MMYEYMEFADQTLVTHSAGIGRKATARRCRSILSDRKWVVLIPHGVNCRLIDG